jgi:hypothetical protein
MDGTSAGAAGVAATADGRASMLLRSGRLAHPVNPGNQKAVNDVVSTVIDTSPAQVLAHQAVDLQGLRGEVYVYTFNDAATGQKSLHWHYFLFDKNRLQVLVLQVTPATAYGSVASTFDAISRRVRPV